MPWSDWYGFSEIFEYYGPVNCANVWLQAKCDGNYTGLLTEVDITYVMST